MTCPIFLILFRFGGAPRPRYDSDARVNARCLGRRGSGGNCGGSDGNPTAGLCCRNLATVRPAWVPVLD